MNCDTDLGVKDYRNGDVSMNVIQISFKYALCFE